MPHQAPQVLRPASKRQAPKTSKTFKNQQTSHPRDLQVYNKTKMTLKVSHADLPAPGLSSEAVDCAQILLIDLY